MYASKEKLREYQRKYYLKPYSRWANFVRQLYRYYKLTELDYLQLLWRTKGRCYNTACQKAGLEKKGMGLAVDHDHKTGKVRGLLCQRCNAFLAYLETVRDRKDIMGGLHVYLVKNGLPNE
jgi:hypothetical protein